MADRTYVNQWDNRYWGINANRTVYVFEFDTGTNICMVRLGTLHSCVKYSRNYTSKITGTTRAVIYLKATPASNIVPDHTDSGTTTFALQENKYVTDASDTSKFPGLASKWRPHPWFTTAFYTALTGGRLGKQGNWFKAWWKTSQAKQQALLDTSTQEPENDEGDDNDEDTPSQQATMAGCFGVDGGDSAFDMSPQKDSSRPLARGGSTGTSGGPVTLASGATMSSTNPAAAVEYAAASE
jgi:hypothetical protein